MKKHLLSCAMLIAMIGTLQSCSTSSITSSQRKNDVVNSKENTSDCFVQLNDGSIQSYKTLKLVTSPFHTPYLLADGKTKLKASQIKAYQNNDHYAISQKTFASGRKTYIATETLPGFAIRTVKGRLNVYYKKYMYGQVTADEYFLQSENDGTIQPYSNELMTALLKDNTEASWFFKSNNFKGSFPEKLQATVLLYNGSQLVSKK